MRNKLDSVGGKMVSYVYCERYLKYESVKKFQRNNGKYFETFFDASMNEYDTSFPWTSPKSSVHTHRWFQHFLRS